MSRHENLDTRLAHSRLSGECQFMIASLAGAGNYRQLAAAAQGVIRE
jgi:hypothetical protein